MLPILMYLGFLPTSLIAISFLYFEALIFFNISYSGTSPNYTILILISIINLIISLRFLTFFKKNFDQKINVRVTEFLIFVFVSYLILHFFLNYNYVTPSGSVLYYIFYDYLRYYFDTGFYRPSLPIIDPVGTWLTMLTYHPGIYAPIALIANNSEFTQFRLLFSLIIALSYISTMSWLSILSFVYLKNVFVGILIFLFSFSYFFFPGLIQTMYMLGSHDTPFLMFTSISIVFVIFSYLARTLSGKFIFFLLSISFSLMGFSLRPYLLSIPPTIFIIGLIYFIYNNNLSSYNLKKNRFWFFICSILVFISSLWFLNLFLKYGKLVVYNPLEHLSEIKIIKNNHYDSISVFVNIVSNNIVDKIPYYGDTQFILILFSVLILIRKIYNESFNRDINFFLFIPLLFTIIPIITGYGTAWKAYYPFLCYFTLIFPIIMIGNIKELNKKISLKNNLLQPLIITLIGILLIFNYFPNSETIKILTYDEEFREKVAKLDRNGNIKILILRGGEPGGDAHIKWKRYYYWDNVFLYGEFDKLYINSNFDLKDVLCKIKVNNIKIIFQPNTIFVGKNHSGELIYRKFIDLILNNPLFFEELFSRNDVYKGKVYKISEKYLNKYLNNNTC